jgi:lipopolysaccharide cholinephosphotransferase
LFETIELEFEDRYFHAPSGYDEILTRYYGNYRVLPPEIERVTHPSYKTYKVEKSEDSTIEQSRIYPFNCENNI